MKWPRHYETCVGYTQSPISIDECGLVRRTKNKLFPRWKFTENLAIKNTGHTLLVDGIQDSFSEFEGHLYQAVQFHFHSGSEHLLHDEQYPLELHVVHIDGFGRPALVVAIVFDVGAPSPDLEILHFNSFSVPQRSGQQMEIKNPFNPVHFMPYNKNYYTYDGSLTTPPCTEGIRWVVMQSTMTASNDQIRVFPYHTNYRNPQALMGRPVYFMSMRDTYVYETSTTAAAGTMSFSWCLALGAIISMVGYLQ